MSDTPAEPRPESTDSQRLAYYRGLLEQSLSARKRGDHRQAQQLASAAHKWAMEEVVRQRRIDHGAEELRLATRHLETAWDKDRSCATLDELGERHPELRTLIARCAAIRDRLASLQLVDFPAPPVDQPLTRPWRARPVAPAD